MEFNKHVAGSNHWPILGRIAYAAFPGRAPVHTLLATGVILAAAYGSPDAQQHLDGAPPASDDHINTRQLPADPSNRSFAVIESVQEAARLQLAPEVAD